MDFKLEEVEDFDEEELDTDEDDNNEEVTDDEEFDSQGFDDKTAEENADKVAYEPDEPDEPYDEEDESDEETSSLILKEYIEIDPFSQQEENIPAYTEAVIAYYEDKNYEHAIEKFGEAIKNAKRQTRGKQLLSNEIVAKSMYWQAESYVKTQDIPKAIDIFESLVKTCSEHYLTIAAQRRAELLKAKHS
ncbi:hypothetical protein F4212_16150 [Candidatus Poribacteria bacterium]|nr:hypothetical protein [Candidatus Poribacteria bacterium]